MSQMMWVQVLNLSEAEIETIGKFVQEGFQASEYRRTITRYN